MFAPLPDHAALEAPGLEGGGMAAAASSAKDAVDAPKEADGESELA